MMCMFSGHSAHPVLLGLFNEKQVCLFYTGDVRNPFFFLFQLNYNCCALENSSLNKSAKKTVLPVGIYGNEGLF